MINLYDYQEQYISEIKTSFAQGKKKIVLCSATGSGKTVMFSFMTKQAFERNKKILILIYFILKYPKIYELNH